MAVKLNMSKAYDRVEWPFLEAIMRKLGFADQWISRIMTCMRTTSYSIMVNEAPIDLIYPSRGLRQGDPLSPYLFLLCAKGLSALLSSTESVGRITGVSMAVGGVKISHLLFVDDGIIFCRSNFEEWCNMHQLLNMYEIASGQKLNSTKTSIFFNKNTNKEFRAHIKSILGIRDSTSVEKYLGLSSMVGRAKRQTLAYIQGRV
jgi:hypothetical protein